MLGLIFQGARAWTEPTQAPPGGNLDAPVNTSSNTQVKKGSMGVNSNGWGSTNTTGLDVGGKAIADDFCLRTGACLSATAGITCRVVTGRVNSDGTIFSGTGFTVRRFERGCYEITFSQPFNNVPIITTTNVNGNIGGAGDKFASNAYAESKTTAKVNTYNMNALNRDDGFYFIAADVCP